MPLKICIVQFLNGIKDSLYGCINFFYRQKQLAAERKALETKSTSVKSSQSSGKSSRTKPDKTEKLHQRLFESCILNGVFLLSCMLAFSYILLPILNYIYYTILSPKNHDLINTYLNPLLQLVFSFVWILPVFLLSKIFNVLWHQEIGNLFSFVSLDMAGTILAKILDKESSADKFQISNINDN